MTNDNTPKKACGFDRATIVRCGDGKLVFVGLPSDGRGVAVENINNGTATAKDYEMLMDVPVCEEADMEDAPITIVAQVGHVL